MAYTIIDRTLNPKRSSGNRSKFLRRVKKQINEQMKKAVASGNIDDLVKGKGKKVNVPKKNLKQPTFHHGKGGEKEYIHPGNKRYSQGDRIDRPQADGGGGGKQASDSGEGEDSFSINLTQDEYFDLFFADCELPDLTETTIAKSDTFVNRRAGFSVAGPISNLNISRTMRQSKGRRIGLRRGAIEQKLSSLEKEEARLVIDIAEIESEGKSIPDEMVQLLKELREKITAIKQKLKAIPFIDNTDLRFNRWEKVPIPITQAVMFPVMDVSGSMTEWDKEMAKRYFMILYLFLTRNYEKVEVVFIRHTHTAQEVDEQEFFYSRQSGGTMVSTALKLMTEIIQERFPPTEWNIYCSQASDGENWSNDTAVCIDHLANAVLPIMKYYTYIEINKDKTYDSELWKKYEPLSQEFKNFQMKKVNHVSEIYPVFKDLFKKK